MSEKTKENRQKVNVIHSISAEIMLLVAFVIVLAVGVFFNSCDSPGKVCIAGYE